MKRRSRLLWVIAAVAVLFLACTRQEQAVPTTVSIEPAAESPMVTTEATEPMTEETSPVLPALREPRREDFVAVAEYIPSLRTELKYATEDNFTGKILYPFQDAYLRYGTVLKLQAAAQELEQLGFRLKIWDGFRPVSAQFALWEACPDPNFVANPNRGFSNHTRGNAVDVTLEYEDGREVDMPTGFDDFSPLADRDYSDCPDYVAENALLLEKTMERHGFRGYEGEWWHFSDSEEYDVETVFDPGVLSLWYADCQEYISLRESPSTDGAVICRIPREEQLLLLGYDEGFALVQWMGFRGYVLLDYIAPLGE